MEFRHTILDIYKKLIRHITFFSDIKVRMLKIGTSLTLVAPHAKILVDSPWVKRQRCATELLWTMSVKLMQNWIVLLSVCVDVRWIFHLGVK